MVDEGAAGVMVEVLLLRPRARVERRPQVEGEFNTTGLNGVGGMGWCMEWTRLTGRE